MLDGWFEFPKCGTLYGFEPITKLCSASFFFFFLPRLIFLSTVYWLIIEIIQLEIYCAIAYM